MLITPYHLLALHTILDTFGNSYKDYLLYQFPRDQVEADQFVVQWILFLGFLEDRGDMGTSSLFKCAIT